MTFEQAGLAAMLPGMVHMAELMQKEIDRIKRMLSEAQENGGKVYKPRGSGSVGYWAKMSPEERSEEMKRRYQSRKRSGQGSYWDKMTPEERKAEMKRRIGKRKKRKGASKGGAASPNHPSNPNHPGHEEFRKKMSEAGKRRFAA